MMKHKGDTHKGAGHTTPHKKAPMNEPPLHSRRGGQKSQGKDMGDLPMPWEKKNPDHE